MEKYVQVGQMALRGPGGKCLPAVPLYVRERDVGGKSASGGFSVGEESILDGMAAMFADIYKYQQERDNILQAGTGK